MQGYHEKTLLETEFPFRFFFQPGYGNVPHHWHEDIEIIYILDGTVKVGVNKNTYDLKVRDILIIAPGEVHYFLMNSEAGNRAVIQFRMSVYDSHLLSNEARKTIRTLFTRCIYLTPENKIHKLLEEQIKAIILEETEKQEGYKLFLRGKLYDLAGTLIRYMPGELICIEKENRHEERLERLDKVIQYVEANYQENINLEQISQVIGFSKYHFTRFFKEIMGMTFVDYINNFRIAKAEWYLLEGDYTILEVAMKSGFNSVKTFNRVFKQIKGCSPNMYRKIVNKK